MNSEFKNHITPIFITKYGRCGVLFDARAQSPEMVRVFIADIGVLLDKPSKAMIHSETIRINQTIT